MGRHSRPEDLEPETRFFTFRQNNSGGWEELDNSRGIGHRVILEAHSAQDANRRAEDIGLYFDGTLTGRDCECCGNRWSPQWGDEPGDPVPSVMGKRIILLPTPYGFSSTIDPSEIGGYVHRISGEIIPFV